MVKYPSVIYPCNIGIPIYMGEYGIYWYSVFFSLRLDKSENSAYLSAFKLFDEFLHNFKIIFQKTVLRPCEITFLHEGVYFSVNKDFSAS